MSRAKSRVTPNRTSIADEPRKAGAPARAILALLETVRLFGFLCWAYLAANSISHPVTMAMQLTHLATWPHENTVGVGAFIASLVSAVLLALHEPTAVDDTR
jgi:hypothetical protein